MKNILQIDLPSFSRYLMNYTFTILIIFIFTTNAFSQDCDETTRARMIKSGISDATIEEQCGKIGEKVESKDTVEEEKVSEEDPSVNKRWRFGGGDGSGTFKYKDSSVPALNGKFDHDLKGGNFQLNYITIKEDNFFHGGGWASLNVSGPETFSEDALPGYYTYYSSTYGYFDLSVTVTTFRSNFFHGIYGYNYVINDEMSLQPNLRYGIDIVVAEWNEKVDWASYTDQEERYSENSQ